MPLVLGDNKARWLTTGPVVVWSIIVPGYWRVGCLTGWIAVLLPGFIVARRLLACKVVKSDRKAFSFCALWIIGLYAIPAIKATWG